MTYVDLILSQGFLLLTCKNSVAARAPLTFEIRLSIFGKSSKKFTVKVNHQSANCCKFQITSSTRAHSRKLGSLNCKIEKFTPGVAASTYPRLIGGHSVKKEFEIICYVIHGITEAIRSFTFIIAFWYVRYFTYVSRGLDRYLGRRPSLAVLVVAQGVDPVVLVLVSSQVLLVLAVVRVVHGLVVASPPHVPVLVLIILLMLLLTSLVAGRGGRPVLVHRPRPALLRFASARIRDLASDAVQVRKLDLIIQYTSFKHDTNVDRYTISIDT